MYLTCHDTYLILCHSLAIPKHLYLLRKSPCFLSSSLNIYDGELRATICSSFNISLAESDPTWMQSTLPVRHGGLDIQSVVQLAPSIFLASAAASSELACIILPGNTQQPQFSYMNKALVCLVPRVSGTTPPLRLRTHFLVWHLIWPLVLPTPSPLLEFKPDTGAGHC